jgi:tight adherence protein B
MLILLFAAIFATVALVLLAVFSAGADDTKQTLARLDSIRPGRQNVAGDEPLVVRRSDALSAIPWLNSLLERLDVAPKLRLLLYQAEVSWTAGRLLLTSVFLGIVPGWLVYMRTGSMVLGMVFTVFFGSLPFLYVLRERNNRFDRLRQRLPEALDMMVSAIRAGHSFTSAMGLAAKESPEPVKREFRQCFDEQNFGMDLRNAMVNLATRVPTKDIRMITAAVLIQKETGGNLTEILEKVSTLIREDFRLQRQVRVHTAQGRMTGWILSILPVVLGIALYLLNPKQMSILWERQVGLDILYGAGVMTIIGGLIIRKIVRVEI